MKNLLLALIFLQVAPKGVVTGIVRATDGKPAAAVRVYAMAVPDEKAGAGIGPALESIAETDSTGRYRLEVPPGRYYIAAGSVDRPTYFPGTTDTATARVISIASAALIDGIDFSTFVAAVRTPSGMPSLPNATGVLGGTIRYPDGTAAAGVYVSATRAGIVSGFAADPLAAQGMLRALANISAGVPGIAQTDANGHYRLDGLPGDSYYVGAGFADSPAFYPGVQDKTQATTIATTPATNFDNLNFTIPLPAKVITVRGKAFGAQGLPVADVSVQLRTNPAGPLSLLLPARPFRNVRSAADGSFEIADVFPGRYAIDATLAGVRAIAHTIDVAEQPVDDVRISFQVANVSGRILWEDGSPFSDVGALKEVAVVSGTGSNDVETTILPLDSNGNFSRILEAKSYRFYLRILPDDYTIRSITSNGTDLIKESLKISDTSNVNIDVRLAKRTDTAGTKVRGRVLDSLTGKPTTADAIQLCCMETGPVERLATHIQPDGSFEFTGIPPGTYTADLRGRMAPMLADNAISVANEDVSDVVLISAAELIPVAIQLVMQPGTSRPMVLTLRFTGEAEVLPIMARLALSSSRIWLPIGNRYKVSVQNIPVGFVVKSILAGSTDLLNGDRLKITKESTGTTVVVTLGPPGQ